jgi:hypothetical protein
MRKLILSTLWIPMLTLSSCLKSDLAQDFSDYDPIVKMDSVSYPGDGSAGFFGHIERVGASDIEVLGFYQGMELGVNELSNQILLEPTNGNFEVWVEDLVPDSTYTVGCFAANSFGSSKSEIITKVPLPEPIIAPCTITEGTLTFMGSTAPTNSEYASFDNDIYEMEASSSYLGSSLTMIIRFNAKPVNGKYIIDSFGYSNGTKKSVSMRVLFGGTYYSFKDNDNIYIEQLSGGPNNYRVTICNSTFQFTQSTAVTCKTHFITH